MAGCEELAVLLETTLLPDLEEAVDELFETIAEAKSADEEAKREYAELQELRATYTALLHDLREGELEDEECAEIYEALKRLLEEE